jgi:putative transposase
MDRYPLIRRQAMARDNGDRIGGLLQEVFSSREGMKEILELLVNAAMREEVTDRLGAEIHERSPGRTGYRNGAKARGLATRVGKLELSVPQVRGCEPYHPSMFGRWQRSERALLVACAEMYFQGVSTRKVRDVLEEMCGGEISSATVSRVAAEVDDKLAMFRTRRLDVTEYPYVKIDARYEKVRVNGQVVSQAVLVVAGYTSKGRREILDWRVADSESECTWGEVMRGLKDRGLRGVKLIVSDAHSGIRAAIGRHFQGVAWQRCAVHFKRELMKVVSYKAAKELMEEAAWVFKAEERQECVNRGEEMASRWEGRYPKVAKMLREGLEDCLTVYSFPREHQKRLRSTNMLEILMKRLKARTRVVGVFPNVASCERLVGAMLLEVHEEWAVEKTGTFNMDNQ